MKKLLIGLIKFTSAFSILGEKLQILSHCSSYMIDAIEKGVFKGLTLEFENIKVQSVE